MIRGTSKLLPSNVVKPLIRPFANPFQILRYLEWMLLIIVALTGAFLPAPFSDLPRMPGLTILATAAFGAMGLQLPKKNQPWKVGYTAASFVLVILITATGGTRLFALLYLILVIRGCLMFRITGRLVVTAIAFILFLISLWYFARNIMVPLDVATQLGVEVAKRIRIWVISLLLIAILLFILSLGFALLLTNAMLAERLSREKLETANDRLRHYALRIEDQAALQERNRIARDIHDSLGHSLTALNLQLETALKLWSVNPTQARTFLAEAKQLGTTALQEIRQSVSVLRSDPLRDQSLEVALNALVQNFYRTTGVSPTCQLQLPYTPASEVATTIYRIVQEALTNICKYSRATTVNIQLQPDVRLLDQLILIIQDNGKGFEVRQNTTGFGLQSMRERTLSVGGQFQVISQPNAGCQIRATFPRANTTH
jgi:signal transduction histidine kinase